MSFLKHESGLLVLTILLGVAFFLWILTSDLSAFMKGVSSIAILLVTGLLIRSITSAEGWSGFLMFRIKNGIKVIEYGNRKFGRWMDSIADFGLIFGFGLLSLKLFKHISTRTFIFSFVLLGVFSLLVAPYITLIALTTMDIPTLDTSGETSSTAAFVSLFILLFTGFAGSVIFGLLMKASSIIMSLVYFLAGMTSQMNSTPGVSFIIPGITIPLLEGAIALLILLIVHEGGHGIAALRAKIKIRSTGFLLFGFIPVGAFVDINDKSLSKKDVKHRLRVAVAGAASNIMTTMIFFIPTMVLLSALPMFYSDHVIIAGFSRTIDGFNVSANTVIFSINGMEINSLSDFSGISSSIKPNSTAVLVTDKGTYEVPTDSAGKMGLYLSQPIKQEYGWLHSLYLILALTTVLNYFVGVINLLPVQAFDGYRILSDSVKDKRIVAILSYVVLASLLVNLLPWIWS